jgi:hypothetical protein
MKVYNYHPDTKVFRFEEDADPDPLIQGRWLVPAHATTVGPTISARENELLQFNEEEQVWNIIEKPVLVIPYNILRAQAYPSIFDYIDGVVKNDHEQIDKYIKACQEVKIKYPKSNN